MPFISQCISSMRSSYLLTNWLCSAEYLLVLNANLKKFPTTSFTQAFPEITSSRGRSPAHPHETTVPISHTP